MVHFVSDDKRNFCYMFITFGLISTVNDFNSQWYHQSSFSKLKEAWTKILFGSGDKIRQLEYKKTWWIQFMAASQM